MEYAIIKTGGKQYRVSEGDIIEIDRLEGENEKSISFDDVLLWVSGSNIKIGKPVLSEIKVKAKILEQKKGEKIRVSKFKAKARYRRTTGFRAFLSKVVIEKIEAGEKNSSKATEEIVVKKASAKK